MSDGWYWVNARFGCGGVEVRGGVIVNHAPIFRKLKGERIEKIARYYQVVKLKGD